jgi:hypothetical protein
MPVVPSLLRCVVDGRPTRAPVLQLLFLHASDVSATMTRRVGVTVYGTDSD